jgi:predicted ATPase
VDANNGYVFQIIGDAFCAAFHTASDALNAAIEGQHKLQTEDWGNMPIKVRMGIHTGEAELQAKGDYHGYLAMSRVQRLMSAGHGGQVLISLVTESLLRGQLPGQTTLRDMGERRLKDLIQPEHIYQLVIPNLPSDFPPLKTLDIYRHNLPAQTTTFIGREQEISEVKQELEKHRLVTLTGSGGTGKTRLSLQVAVDLLDHFQHGIWFIELAPLTDPNLIPQTILSAMGIQEQPGRIPLDALKEYLQEKQALILLDNCEHLVSASARVADILLGAAPTLKILASSREALGVKGEMSYPVPSLSHPDIKHLPAIEQLSQYEAVRLFIDRALLVAPHFVVDKDNAPFIAQICYRLDGIPLAIELAAARIKMLSVEQISKRLDDRFRLLTGGARTALPRQQTLRALIDWSYDLLTENERLLLRRLSVFMGGWTLEAAEEVCVAQDDILRYDMLDLLTQLVNKSLVTVIEHSQSGEARYRMLETIRQYAREKLLEAGGSESVRAKHLAHFVKLAEQAESELYRSNQVFWLNKLDDELDNLRVALEWSLATDITSGLRIASIPWRFWDARGYLQELGGWLDHFLRQYKNIDRVHVLALNVCSVVFFRRGNFTEAIKIAEQSLQMARALLDKQLEASSLSILGVFTQLQGRVDEGVPLLEQSLAISRALGDQIRQANTLEWLSYDHTNLERAIAYAHESLRIHRDLNNLIGIANILIVLARLTIWNGDFSAPVAWLEEALSISRQIGDQLTENTTMTTLGILAYWQGDYQMAVARFEEAILRSEKIGDQYGILWVNVRMAHVLLRQGDLQHARELFAASIEKAQKTNFVIVLVYAIEGLASLYVNQNQPERAARLFAWADAMREKIGDHRPPIEQASVERDLAVIHSKIDDTEIPPLSAEGRTMTVEQAIALALEE